MRGILEVVLVALIEVYKTNTTVVRSQSRRPGDWPRSRVMSAPYL